MTIDETIEYIDKTAEMWEKDAKKWFNYTRSFGAYKGACEECIKCKKHAEEHRQLAKWLKELKQLKEQEPKTGHWINIDETHSKCDRCGAVFEIASENGEANYCPNCGAKMAESVETKQGLAYADQETMMPAT